jgi:hypothetical protein
VDDSPGQLPQILQGILGIGLQSAQEPRGSLRVSFCHSLREPQFHHQRDELLLRAVVDIALQGLGSGVLRAHDALPRSSKLLDEPDVPEHQPG